MGQLLRALSNPRLIVSYLGHRGCFRSMSDEVYLGICYRAYIGKKLNLTHPRGFNEKLQWLKINDRNPAYTMMVDKYQVKQWVANTIGEEYVIPTLAAWESVDEIDLSLLPECFVLKTNHDSGCVAICSNRNTFDFESRKNILRARMQRNYFWGGREWPYKNVKPLIFAEAFLDPKSVCDCPASDSREKSNDISADLVDYKFMCFGGKVKCIFTCSGRSSGDMRVDFFDLEWNHLPFARHYPTSEIPPEAPQNLKKLIDAAEKLSQGIPFVRVDFYEVSGRNYFGEMTFYPGSGLEEFSPEDWDIVLGDWIDLNTAYCVVKQ